MAHSQGVAVLYFITTIFIGSVVWYPSSTSDQLKNITSNKIMRNLVNSDHLQCRCYPLLLNEFKHFNIKVAVGPVVQKEVYEQLVKGATKHIYWWC